MNKIKILFLMPHTSTGGMPQFALKRIEALINSPEFELFVVEYSDFSWEYVVQKNKIKKLIKAENFWTLGQDKTQLIDIIKNNNIDILHVDELLEGFESFNQVSLDLMERIYDKDRTWKIIETCHNVWFDPNVSKKFHPDAYAFCSPWHLNTFSEMPSYKEVIEYPIENNVVSEEEKIKARNILGLDLDKIHVINVGLWTANKNQGEGVKIAKLVQEINPNIQFHFIGNQAPNFEDYWGDIMKDIPTNVTVWGERSDVDLFMKAADIFMFNSIWECNPLVLREAISYGLKIISRNLPQYIDMFTPYITVINDDIITTINKFIELTKSDKKYEIPLNQSNIFSENYLTFYKKVKSMDNIIQTKIISKPEISQFFIDNPFIEIRGEESNKKYKIEFHDETGYCHYSEELKINHWIRLNRKYYTKWNTKIWENGTLIYDYTLNLKNKRVLITLESKSLGDTLAWVPYIREFKDKHQCNLVVSTFMNNLFRETYPDIEFIEPGTNVNNLYALYRIGWYYNEDGKFDEARNPSDFKKIPLQKCASDILGLEYKEVRPLLKLNDKKIRKKVGIGIHSTAQAKYWNRPNGWQEIVNYLNANGFDVYLYSNENNGYMGNYNPDGIIKYKSGSIEKLIDDMSTCQFFIGLGSGLSWLAWALKLPVVLISGFSEEYSETTTDTYRVINNNVCHGCFNSHRLDAGDWNWCPIHKNTQRMFECTREITPGMIINEIEKLLSY